MNKCYVLCSIMENSCNTELSVMDSTVEGYDMVAT
jgi:hypothetical protein